jgi:hypothetical protein
MKWYFKNYADIPYDLTTDDLKGIQAFWDAAKKLQIVKGTPPVKSVIWDRAIIK